MLWHVACSSEVADLVISVCTETIRLESTFKQEVRLNMAILTNLFHGNDRISVALSRKKLVRNKQLFTENPAVFNQTLQQ
jgi:hypothetical protein